MALSLLVALAGCGSVASSLTKEDIMTKLKDAASGDDVRKALGKPDVYDFNDVPIVGKTESLTYKGKDGDVTVVVLNNKIVAKGSDPAKKKKD